MHYFETNLEAVDGVGDVKAVKAEEDASALWHTDGDLAVLAVRVVTSAQMGDDPPVAMVDNVLTLTVHFSLDKTCKQDKNNIKIQVIRIYYLCIHNRVSG